MAGIQPRVARSAPFSSSGARNPVPNPDAQHATGGADGERWRGIRLAARCSISAGCPHLPRRSSGPTLKRMCECAHLMKADQPRNLGHVQLAVIEIPNGQIAPQLLKYFGEV